MMSKPVPRVIVATQNQGKVRELQQLLLLTGWDISVAHPEQLGDPHEKTAAEGATFAGNATLKAEAACAASGLWALADDSGLCVDALNGGPGVDTAHFGGWPKLVATLDGITQRQAHFMCVIALARPGQETLTFTGRIDGQIAPEGRGNGGHGYDPVFIPQGHSQTYGELGDAAKVALSHRSRAIEALLAWWKEQLA